MRSIRSVTALGVSLALAATLATTPALAQQRHYVDALASGELTALIPDAYAGFEPGPDLPFSAGLGPASIDDEAAAAARAALLDTITGAGATVDDVQAASGFVEADEGVFGFSAIRIPGVPASDWFELYYDIAMTRSFSDPARSSLEVGDKSVLVIAERARDRSQLIYPQGEVLWFLTSDGPAAVGFLEGLETVDGGTLSTDRYAPADGEPVEVIGTLDDPVSQIPPTILGQETMTQTFPVAAVLEGVDRSDPETAAQVDELVSLLQGVGGPEAATLISSQARGDDGGIIVLGMSVDGAEHAAFADGFVRIFVLSELDEPAATEEMLGGKPVTRWAEPGLTSFDGPVYVYAAGDTVWTLRGQVEYIAALLRTMP